MIIPETMREKGHYHCEDIIKVFITSQPTSLNLLELPKLGNPAKKQIPNTSGRIGSIDSPEDWVALNFLIRTSLVQKLVEYILLLGCSGYVVCF